MFKTRHWMEWLIVAVSAVTLLSGIVQCVMPEPALAFMGISASDSSVYLFRVVSVLTALFGGALLHTALTSKFESTVLLWSGIQKLVGASAVLIAVVGGLLSSAVLLVAGYDFVAGLYVLWFYSRGRLRT